jgi:hypothetical protein
VRVRARGWKRDHGAKDLARGNLANAVRDEDVDSYERDKTYVRLLSPRVRLRGTEMPAEEGDSHELRVRISMSGELNLNGRYQVQCDLTKTEIARLFQIAHADDPWESVVADLAALCASR